MYAHAHGERMVTIVGQVPDMVGLAFLLREGHHQGLTSKEGLQKKSNGLEGVMCLVFAGPWLSACSSDLDLINANRDSSLE